MKKYFICFRLLLVVILMASVAEVCAAKSSSGEGTSFWFALPTARTGINEPPGGSIKGASEEIYITSKYDATVTIYSAVNNFTTPYKTIAVKADSMTIQPLLFHAIDSIGEKIETKKSYHVVSDQPISLVVNIAWTWTGETFKVIPEEGLGTEYYTLNLYNDYCKMVDNGSGHYSSDGAYRDHPGQILIVATEDNTTVTYTPMADTRLVKAGVSKTVTLNKGNSYLIFSKTDPKKRMQDSTDLTGTRIAADKKIAVFSGHTKGVFPQYNPNYYSFGSGSFSADYLRNLLIEAIPPIEYLGKEYVTVPNMYNNEWKGREYQGLMEDERGDMIRFVATQNNTDIWQTKDNGQEELIAQQLQRGQKFVIKSQETPGHFRANKPVVVGQYGKGWFYWESGKIHYKEGEKNNKEDEFQNPEKSGQGMLYTVTPKEQWTGSAEFSSIAGTNNLMNIIFNTGDEDKIIFRDGNQDTPNTLKQIYSTDIKQIAGSNYSYIRSKVSSGCHSVEATVPGVKFSVFAYGNMDSHKDGFAYGYPANSSSYYSPCADTIIIETVNNDEAINGTISINDLVEGQACAAIQSVKYDQNSFMNAIFTSKYQSGSKTGTFAVNFPDKSKEGYIRVTVISKSGHSLTKEFTYTPDSIKVDQSKLTFNKMQVNVPVEQVITITNPSNKKQLVIKKLYLKNAIPELSIIDPSQTTDIVVPPLGTVNVKIKALLNKETSVADELWAELKYNYIKLATIKANSGKPVISIEDVAFGTVSLSNELFPSSTRTIMNKGTVSALITGYRIKQANPVFAFECPDLIGATPETPFELEPQGSMLFRVTYKPNVADVDHIDTLELFISNATDENNKSVWTGRAVDNSGSGVKHVSYSNSPYPNPASEFINIDEAMLNGAKNIEIYNALGVKVLDVFPAASRINISELPSGVYTIKFGDSVQNFVKY